MNHYEVNNLNAIYSIEGLLTPEQFIGFCKGNIIKYTIRYDKKGGIEDLNKANHYITILKDFEARQEVKNGTNKRS